MFGMLEKDRRVRVCLVFKVRSSDKTELEKKAQEEGISLSKYIRKTLGIEDDEEKT